MGNLFSLYSGSFFSDPFEDRRRTGEDKWLEIEKIPEEDNSRLPSKKHSKKTASKYAESLRPVDRTQIRCEMSLEEKMYHDLFGVHSNTEDSVIKEKPQRKKSDEELQLSELIFENNSGEDNDSDNLSCCDTVHTEDLTRRGITRQMAADIAFECRHWAKQDSERNANQLKLKPGSSETVAQHLAKTGQFVNAETSDSKDQANIVNANQSSVESQNPLAQEDIKGKGKKRSKKMKRKHRKIDSSSASTTDAEPGKLACPTLKKPSDIYKIFQGTREVLSVEPDDEYTKAQEKTDAEEKSTKSFKFWKHGNRKTKVKKFKQSQEINEPSEGEATTSNNKTSKFNIFKKKKCDIVKPFKAPKNKPGCSDEQEVDEERLKWYKVKLSSTAAVMPL